MMALLSALVPAAARAQCTAMNLSGCPSPLFYDPSVAQINGAAPGTVTSMSVATAHGFAGSVANATTAPTVSLTTTVTGVMKGDGVGVSAATPGTDYLAPNGSGAALTGITFSQIAPSAASGQVPVGTGAGMALATLTAGANVSITNGPGSVTISATGTPPLTGTTGAIGGSSLAAGACSAGTVGVTGAASTSVVSATPQTYPGDGFFWSGYVSSSGVVTVKVCTVAAGTPAGSAYNVRVTQ